LASLLLLLAGLVWRLGAHGPSADLEALATEELRDATAGSAKFDIRSDNFDEVQRWVKARMDVDIRPAADAFPGNKGVHVIGARVIRYDGRSVGVITYRVGSDFATLVLTAPARERKEANRPCLLCHAGTPALILLK
jgi:hypothetical protein